MGFRNVKRVMLAILSAWSIYPTECSIRLHRGRLHRGSVGATEGRGGAVMQHRASVGATEGGGGVAIEQRNLAETWNNVANAVDVSRWTKYHSGNTSIPELKFSRAVQQAKVFWGSNGVDFGSPGKISRIQRWVGRGDDIDTGGVSAAVWKFAFSKITVLAKQRHQGSLAASRAFSDNKLGPRFFWPVKAAPADNEVAYTPRYHAAVVTVEELIVGTLLDGEGEQHFQADPQAMGAIGTSLAKLHAVPFGSSPGANPAETGGNNGGKSQPSLRKTAAATVPGNNSGKSLTCEDLCIFPTLDQLTCADSMTWSM
jgi:hypothetical protein